MEHTRENRDQVAGWLLELIQKAAEANMRNDDLMRSVSAYRGFVEACKINQEVEYLEQN